MRAWNWSSRLCVRFALARNTCGPFNGNSFRASPRAKCVFFQQVTLVPTENKRLEGIHESLKPKNQGVDERERINCVKSSAFQDTRFF